MSGMTTPSQPEDTEAAGLVDVLCTTCGWRGSIHPSPDPYDLQCGVCFFMPPTVENIKLAEQSVDWRQH